MASIISLLPIDYRAFAGPLDRERLSEVSVRAFRRLAEHWGLRDCVARALLGTDEASWIEIAGGRWTGSLSQDQLTRAAALIGIGGLLDRAFSDDQARYWPTRVSNLPLFGDATPVDAMIAGGVPKMLDVLHYAGGL
jgi:hypothetical protein